MDQFSKTNRVVVMDPRSHGRSSTSLHGNDYVTHGSDLAKMLEELDLKEVTLVGCVIWLFNDVGIYYTSTEKIKSLVFVDMSPKPLSTNHEENWVEGQLDHIGAAYTTYLQNPEGQREVIAGYATQVMVQRKLEEQELNWLVEQSLKTPYYIAANLFSAGMFSDYRVEAKLASESVPTLTVIAEHWAPLASAFTKKISPGSAVEVLGGHMMFWEHSEKFNEIVDQFLLNGKEPNSKV